MHSAQAKYNLEIRPDKHRKGFVVVDRSSPEVCHIKASAVSRELSGGINRGALSGTGADRYNAARDRLSSGSR